MLLPNVAAIILAYSLPIPSLLHAHTCISAFMPSYTIIYTYMHATSQSQITYLHMCTSIVTYTACIRSITQWHHAVLHLPMYAYTKLTLLEVINSHMSTCSHTHWHTRPNLCHASGMLGISPCHAPHLPLGLLL